MQIFVKMLDGCKTIALDVQANTTIAQIKNMINAKEKIGMKGMRLEFGGKQLHTSATVRSAKLTPLSDVKHRFYLLRLLSCKHNQKF